MSMRLSSSNWCRKCKAVGEKTFYFCMFSPRIWILFTTDFLLWYSKKKWYSGTINLQFCFFCFFLWKSCTSFHRCGCVILTYFPNQSQPGQTNDESINWLLGCLGVKGTDRLWKWTDSDLKLQIESKDENPHRSGSLLLGGLCDFR